jgi:glycosyltransferase involved in cell wall biosynthesis
MISIVTGTLNRKNFLPNLIKNTVESDDRIELVLVDGGSSDGTLEYLKNNPHPRIKLVEVGGRSSYPHFMNLGIENSTHDWVCQWNDDVILINEWEDIIKEIDDGNDFYLFNWKYGSYNDIKNNDWLSGKDTSHPNGGWCVVDNTKNGGEIVMNYGLYNKKIFSDIGMYNDEYRYYYADGDMAMRAHLFGYKHKTLSHIKVCSIITDKKAQHTSQDKQIYDRNINLYRDKILPNTIKKL